MEPGRIRTAGKFPEKRQKVQASGLVSRALHWWEAPQHPGLAQGGDLLRRTGTLSKLKPRAQNNANAAFTSTEKFMQFVAAQEFPRDKC
jgi:hypothetical protein